MADFDLDGFLDIAIANGGILQKKNSQATDLGFWGPYADHNQLLAQRWRGSVLGHFAVQ
jgi:hypothetical protein